MTGNGPACARAPSPEHWLIWSLCCALALAARTSAAQAPARGLVSPSALAPLRVAPGETLSFVVQSATGLTPPPGLQEDRAHRAFSAWLCAQGLPLSAPERACF